MSLPGASPANLFPMPGSDAAKTMTATSGRRCSALLTKSGPLGSLVKMLLESPLWSKEGYSLTWEAVPLYSKRVTNFTDTNLSSPSPSNESAATLSVSDIPSSRCLFRLRLSALPTAATESSSLPLMQTPRAAMACEPPEKMRARAEKNGYRNGTKYGSLESQITYDPRFKNLLPTPMAVDVNHKTRVEELRATGATMHSRVNGDSRPNGLTDFLQFHGMLPTPQAGEAEHYRNQYTPGSQMGTGLSAMAASGMLPTPNARDFKGKTNPGQIKEGSGCVYGETLPDTIDRICSPETAGQTFRLSPLFTQEMMGFPFGWTEYPFLSQSGEPNPSRHTETPSSHK